MEYKGSSSESKGRSCQPMSLKGLTYKLFYVIITHIPKMHKMLL